MSFFKHEPPPPPPSTIIGPKTKFEGDLSSKNEVEINGATSGKIATSTGAVVSGRAEGSLTCATLRASGFLRGELSVASLAAFSSTSSWEGGSLVSGALKVEKGARLNGRLGGPSR